MKYKWDNTSVHIMLSNQKFASIIMSELSLQLCMYITSLFCDVKADTVLHRYLYQVAC